MSAMAHALALKELSSALAALDAPFSSLPNDLTDKNGEKITDVKEKRLALVRQHVQAAGDIINLVEHAEAGVEMAIQAALAQKYRPQIEAAMKARGLPLPTSDPDPDCDCPECVAARAAAGEEPARKFGFAAAVETMEKEKKAEKD